MNGPCFAGTTLWLDAPSYGYTFLDDPRFFENFGGFEPDDTQLRRRLDFSIDEPDALHPCVWINGRFGRNSNCPI